VASYRPKACRLCSPSSSLCWLCYLASGCYFHGELSMRTNIESARSLWESTTTTVCGFEPCRDPQTEPPVNTFKISNICRSQLGNHTCALIKGQPSIRSYQRSRHYALACVCLKKLHHLLFPAFKFLPSAMLRPRSGASYRLASPRFSSSDSSCRYLLTLPASLPRSS